MVWSDKVTPPRRAANKEQLTYIYFLQMEKAHVTATAARVMGRIRVPAKSIKIGYTIDLDKRLKSHAKALPPFTVLGVIAWKNSPLSVATRGDGIEAEDLIQRHFAHSRLDKRKGNFKNHEFFTPTKRLLSFIKRNTHSLQEYVDAPAHELEWHGDEDGGYMVLLPEALFGRSTYELDRRFPFFFHSNGWKMPPSFLKLMAASNDEEEAS